MTSHGSRPGGEHVARVKVGREQDVAGLRLAELAEPLDPGTGEAGVQAAGVEREALLELGGPQHAHVGQRPEDRRIALRRPQARGSPAITGSCSGSDTVSASVGPGQRSSSSAAVVSSTAASSYNRTDADAAPTSSQTTTTAPQHARAQQPGAWDPDRFITAGNWSLIVTSDVTYYIAHGQSISYSTRDGPSYGNGAPTFLEFAYPNDEGNWDAVFLPAPGRTLVAGDTYTDSERYTDPAGPPRATAKIEISGHYTGCNTSTGTFTVEALDFDPNGALRTARVRFEHHCEGNEGALRGVCEFHREARPMIPRPRRRLRGHAHRTHPSHRKGPAKRPHAQDAGSAVTRRLSSGS